MSTSKYILYGFILLLLAVFAVWVFYKPVYLAELKEKGAVDPAVSSEAEIVVGNALKGLDAKDDKLWHEQLMYPGDDTWLEAIELFVKGKSPFTPADVVGFDTLKASHRKDNVQVYVYSRPRKKYYVFALLKDKTGKYKISEIGGADKKSALKFAKRKK